MFAMVYILSNYVRLYASTKTGQRTPNPPLLPAVVDGSCRPHAVRSRHKISCISIDPDKVPKEGIRTLKSIGILKRPSFPIKVRNRGDRPVFRVYQKVFVNTNGFR